MNKAHVSIIAGGIVAVALLGIMALVLEDSTPTTKVPREIQRAYALRGVVATYEKAPEGERPSLWVRFPREVPREAHAPLAEYGVSRFLGGKAEAPFRLFTGYVDGDERIEVPGTRGIVYAARRDDVERLAKGQLYQRGIHEFQIQALVSYDDGESQEVVLEIASRVVLSEESGEEMARQIAQGLPWLRAIRLRVLRSGAGAPELLYDVESRPEPRARVLHPTRNRRPG